jgi:hypothetical protein
MSTARPFAYNTGSTITGTEQIGNLAIGTPTDGFGSTGISWYNGPDEDLGYVITHETPGGQPAADGGTAYLGFWRSDTLNDSSFISLSETVAQQSFASASDAKTWLNNNGYWTSWVSSGPTLLADLDASDGTSYPGTGTIWYDLQGSNDGTLNNGSGTITFGSTDGGEFTLNGGTNTRIEFTDNSDISLSTATTKTYIVWINASRVGFVSFSDTIMSKQSGNPAGDGFWVGINSSNQLVGRVTSDGGSTNKYISGIGATISTGTWYMISLVVKVSADPDTFKMFINTTEVGSTNGGGSSVNDTNNLYLGNYHSGLQSARSFQGKIGEFYVYEGDFTSSDVTTVFNTTKSRFGY